MSHILQLQSGIAWRRYLRVAKFRNAAFRVDVSMLESGRRIVQHEFPKKEIPYAEDMGRRARDFTVRAYIIVFPENEQRTYPVNVWNVPSLEKLNYLPARNKLVDALEAEGPGDLVLPLLGVRKVAVQRYRLTEENRLGGFCVFDMTFTEYGQAPSEGTRQSASGVLTEAQDGRVETIAATVSALSRLNRPL